jgi:aspartate ammonia-lyase
LAAEAGQLQLNVMEPVIAHAILESQTLFMNAARTLREHCIEGITANREVCQRFVETSIGVVTALNPVLGYKRSTAIAAEALRTGKGVIELVREQKLLTEAQIKEHLDPAKMVTLHHTDGR